jgi:hypothetical protein
MRSGFRQIAIASMVFLVCFSVYSKPEAAATWHLLGLEDRSINCILAMDTTMIFAGTSKGISLYWNSKWYDLNAEMPVTSIVRLGSMLFVGAGNGSRSDAVYIGKPIINGPPFYYLEFQHYFLEPTAMAIDSSAAEPRLFVGGRNTIAVGMIGKIATDNDTLLELVPMKLPENPFGTASPHCADLLLFDTTILFAGGYDDSVADQGSLMAHSTMSESDSFQILKSLDVTALARGVLQGGPPQLVIGTRDAGILIYNTSSKTSALLPGPGGLPVNDIITIPTLLFYDMFIAACDSGVFSNNGGSQTWTEVGAIPAPPVCLAQRCESTALQCGTFLAGTVKGVYIYDEVPVHVVLSPAQKGPPGLSKPIFSRNHYIRVPVETVQSSSATVTIYTISGTIYARIPVSNKQAAIRLETGGFYYYECTVHGNVFERGSIVCAK